VGPGVRRRCFWMGMGWNSRIAKGVGAY